MLKYREVILGIFIVLIVGTLILPPSAVVLDFLLMLNILLALVIAMTALYATEPLQMSLFPTILLITTLFRMMLNVAATRLILGEGYAGAVIATFAEFVTRGNLILGFIMFIIMVLANFLVITKGSERVAEVTARFTLDAMPGKQMAIDADLNTGLIDEQEARNRRQKISDEAAFYGSMDGASKFVKGDAIASILIAFISLIGGTAFGILRDGLDFGDAISKYGLLTIGDGLVSQIPALLISVATGILVTKATSESNINIAVTRQLFSNPIIMYITGAVLIFLGTIGRMVWYFSVPFGLLMIFLGYQMKTKIEVAGIESELTAEQAGAVEEMRRPESVLSFMQLDMINLYVGYGLIPMVESSQGGDLADRIFMIRRQLALETGAKTPTIRIQDDIKLSPNEYKIMIKGNEVAGGEIMFDHYLAINPGYVDDEIDGIETVEPYSGLPALWISEYQRERAEALGYNVFDSPAIIATHLTETIRSHLHELLTRQDVQELINNVKESNPVLVDELMPKLMNVGDIQKVLANLLHEGISIRDMVTILETLADFAGDAHGDSDMLTEQVRQTLKRSISKKFFSNGANMVLTLDPGLEQLIIENIRQTSRGSYIALDPATTQTIFGKLQKEIAKITSMGLDPVILTSPIVRTYFKRLVDPIVPNLTVLSYNEIDTSVELQSVGVVSA